MAAEVVLNLGAILAIEESPEVRAELMHIGQKIAETARSNAPRGKRNHAHGADTIHAEETVGGVEVSWDQLHFYMRFPEMGAHGPHGQPAQNFLRDAADHYAR